MRVDGRRRIVSIEDVSLGGVGVFSFDAPEPGTPVHLAFPKQQIKQDNMFEVTGTIIRRGSVGVMGIVFDPGQERIVKQILRTLPALRVVSKKPKAKAPRRRVMKRRRPVTLRMAKKTAKRAARRQFQPKPKRR